MSSCLFISVLHKHRMGHFRHAFSERSLRQTTQRRCLLIIPAYNSRRASQPYGRIRCVSKLCYWLTPMSRIRRRHDMKCPVNWVASINIYPQSAISNNWGHQPGGCISWVLKMHSDIHKRHTLSCDQHGAGHSSAGTVTWARRYVESSSFCPADTTLCFASGALCDRPA